MALSRMIELMSPLDAEDLRFQKMTGTETLGRSFEYEIFALSRLNDIDFDEMLGKHITLKLELPDDSVRCIDGRIVEFGLAGMVGNDFQYRIVSRPWTWILTRTADCRIFQTLSVPAILQAIFADHPDGDFEIKLTGTYAPRDYCVQYRETDFAFVSRLMEEEGMYYFFRHEEGKHTLVVTDSSGAHESDGTVPFLPQDRSPKAGQEYVREWCVSRGVVPGSAATQDYDFQNPALDLNVVRKQEMAYAEGDHEVYDYPGEYRTSTDGEGLARVRIEELQTRQQTVTGVANARILATGRLFTLADFIRQDQNDEFLVVSTTLTAVNSAYESGKDEGIDYRCAFTLVPGDTSYRSARETPRPIVQGPQTAVVVGPAGEEIFVDKYGRVKVQFFWDRYGKSDDQSSCWIRVSQIWAGKQWGWVTHPRIGQEVIVDFLEGNPDDPVITGRVYNALQMPPYELPANKTQSGIKTRSSLGGSPANFNEFRFEDKKGSEQVFLHAEKNQDIEVENDETHWVGHNRAKTIDNDETVHVKHDRTENVDHDESITIGHDRMERVGNDETILIGHDRTETVMRDQTETVERHRVITVVGNHSENIMGAMSIVVGSTLSESVLVNYSETVGGAMELTVGAALAITVGGALAETVGALKSEAVGGAKTETIGGNRTLTVGKDVVESINGGRTTTIAKDRKETIGGASAVEVAKESMFKAKTITLEAADEMNFKCGDAAILLKKDGTITLSGKDINIKGSGNITIKGSKIAQN